MIHSPPPSQGLYDPANEHDACGVGFVADVQGRRSREIVRKGLDALCRMDHRGARGAEPNTGDGAGVLIQIPDGYYRAVVDFDLPPPGRYATGLVFLSTDPGEAVRARRVIEKYALVEGGRVVGWRDVPVDPSGLGRSALDAMPRVVQVFIAADRLTGPTAGQPLADLELERIAFCIRKRAERETRERGITSHVVSLSPR